MTVEVCPDCDIADCHHIRARKSRKTPTTPPTPALMPLEEKVAQWVDSPEGKAALEASALRIRAALVSNVVRFPGETKLDLDPHDILIEASDADLDGVLILGMTKEGEPYFAGSTGDTGYNLILLERFRDFLMEGFR